VSQHGRGVGLRRASRASKAATVSPDRALVAGVATPAARRWRRSPLASRQTQPNVQGVTWSVTRSPESVTRPSSQYHSCPKPVANGPPTKLIAETSSTGPVRLAELRGRPTALIPPAACRDATHTSTWAKPCLAARTHTLTHRSPRPESDHERTHGRSPVQGRTGWAKPCLAGRPTMLVRTQPPETNTSRGRRSGMELPDYTVMVSFLHRGTRTGPTRPGPARSFPYSYLVMAPARSFLVVVARFASRRFPCSCSCSCSCLRG
jgi:hypothetical protein